MSLVFLRPIPFNLKCPSAKISGHLRYAGSIAKSLRCVLIAGGRTKHGHKRCHQRTVKPNRQSLESPFLAELAYYCALDDRPDLLPLFRRLRSGDRRSRTDHIRNHSHTRACKPQSIRVRILRQGEALYRLADSGARIRNRAAGPCLLRPSRSHNKFARQLRPSCRPKPWASHILRRRYHFGLGDHFCKTTCSRAKSAERCTVALRNDCDLFLVLHYTDTIINGRLRTLTGDSY
jgi:hypothetical protein